MFKGRYHKIERRWGKCNIEVLVREERGGKRMVVLRLLELGIDLELEDKQARRLAKAILEESRRYLIRGRACRRVKEAPPHKAIVV